MEKASSRSLDQCFLLVEVVGYLIYDSILIWISQLQKLSSRFSICSSKIHETHFKRNDSPASSCEEDKGKQDLIKREDIEMVMERMGMSLSQESDKLIVSYDEIYTIFEKNEPTMEEVETAFYVFDENRDGFIDATDLQRALSKLGFAEGTDLEACQSMIDAQDQDNDGRIDYNEFVRFMESSFC